MYKTFFCCCYGRKRMNDNLFVSIVENNFDYKYLHYMSNLLLNSLKIMNHLNYGYLAAVAKKNGHSLRVFTSVISDTVENVFCLCV